MTSKDVAQLLVDLGVTKSHSRAHVSDDNPFSGVQFKTAKYHPSTPARFGSVEEARGWAQDLFHWYNEEHHHTSLGLLTPAQVHHGLTAEVLEARQEVLEAAYVQHPERFVRGRPQPAAPPTEVWLNPPLTPAPAVDLAAQPSLHQPRAGAVSRGNSAAALDADAANGYAGTGELQRQAVTVTAP
jgi:putative transposase